MVEVVPAHTLLTLHPHPLPLCINCRDKQFKELRLEIIIEKTMWYTEMRNENESQEFCIDFVLL